MTQKIILSIPLFLCIILLKEFLHIKLTLWSVTNFLDIKV